MRIRLEVEVLRDNGRIFYFYFALNFVSQAALVPKKPSSRVLVARVSATSFQDEKPLPLALTVYPKRGNHLLQEAEEDNR